jgi:hypothetical protein
VWEWDSSSVGTDTTEFTTAARSSGLDEYSTLHTNAMIVTVWWDRLALTAPLLS